MTAATALAGMPTASGPSPYSFVLFDCDSDEPGLDTAYVCDDRAPPAGGVQKWTSSGGTWTLASTFNQGLAAGCRGLTGLVTGANVTLIAVTADAQPTIVSFVDDGSGSPPSTLLATSPAGAVYRGVALAPQ